MSFSVSVKEELSWQWNQPRHCQIAELAALLGFCGTVSHDVKGHIRLRLSTENLPVARKVFTLFEKTFKILPEISIKRSKRRKNPLYTIAFCEEEIAVRVLKATKLFSHNGKEVYEGGLVNPLVVQRMCCRRAFLRGAFLAAGSMSDPGKTYHFEIVCMSKKAAEQVRDLIYGFGLAAKVILRKKSYVVYLKESERIVDILNIMEAHISLMELENIRILKDMRNTVNRKVNCETANINKTVSAAVKQVEDINYLRETVGLEALEANLEQVALVRLSHQDATLKELGEYLDPPVGKSGVNHRLRKISEIANKVRLSREGYYD